eukprot:scaffold324349_cov86-Tisochrysis_lutea.AAC.1
MGACSRQRWHSCGTCQIALIEKRSLPKSLKEVQLQAFLGLANHFRKFVEHFSTVVAPPTALCGQTAVLASWQGKQNEKVSNVIDWNIVGPLEYTQEKVQADGSVKHIKTTVAKVFQRIEKGLICAPVLAIPDLNKAIQVHTGASVVGTGA